MTEQVNPLLAKAKLPGRIFQLPSRGIFYKNGELDESVKNGEIHVQPLSAMDEIIMKNPDQLFSGMAVQQVYTACVRGVLKPTELLAKDVDAIMLFLRTVTYGPSFEYTVKHECKDAKEHSYVANIDQMINELKMIDPTTVDDVYQVQLPNGQLVKLRPNRYSQMIELIKHNQGKTELTVDDQKYNFRSMLSGMIESVDGVTDPKLISEWIDALQSTFTTRLTNKLEEVNGWGPTMKWKTKCADCGETFDVELPINPVSFFTE